MHSVRAELDLLCAAARRYPVETEVSAMAPEDCWALASLWLDSLLTNNPFSAVQTSA